MVEKIIKRDDRVVDYDIDKIRNAIYKASKTIMDNKEAEEISNEISNMVDNRLNNDINNKIYPSVELIQDMVEETLMDNGYTKVSKEYILYRNQREKLRNSEDAYKEVMSVVKGYIRLEDWKVNENSNMSYSLQGLNNHISSEITKRFWLDEIYSNETKMYHDNGDFHIHDLGLLAGYCVGWDLKDLLLEGFSGVPTKVQSSPPKHYRSLLGQMYNFLYSLQGETAGAQAFSNFDTYLAPFVYYDELTYDEVKQGMQEFIFNMNVPTRVGFQAVFSNITMDLTVSEALKDEYVIVGGEYKDKQYKEFQDEMDMINRAFAEVMLEGDATGGVFPFPIPTYNITEDFDWDNEVLDPVWEMTAKYGIPYFQNMISSDLDPGDVRSMCCRLQISNKELKKRGGGLFGSNPLTGSLGVVTLNMPRIGYNSSTKKEYLNRVEELMEAAKDSLELKRKVIENFTENDLYPYSKFYLRDVKKRSGRYWENHFSTIGLNGMNESVLNFMGKDMSDDEAIKFTEEVMDFMNNKLKEFQDETGNLYNLEASPAEGTSYSLAKIDRERYPDIIVANENRIDQDGVEPYYTNSTQLPVGLTDDIFTALDLQDQIQKKYSGGCVEKGNNVLTNKGIYKIEYIVENYEELKPIKALSYNPEKEESEWDLITDAMSIDVSKNDKIIVNAEKGLNIVTSDWHPFFVLDEISDSDRYEVIEKRADELEINDYILQNNKNMFPDVRSDVDEDIMWLFGYFMGNGSISKYIDDRGGNGLERYVVRFYDEHPCNLKNIKRILDTKFGTDISVLQKDKRSEKLYEIGTRKKNVVDLFFEYGFYSGEKCYDIGVPEKVKNNITKNNVYSLLSGLMDSDGHINKRNGDFEYYTVSEGLADDMVEIFTKAGIMIGKFDKPTKRENEVDGFRIRIPSYQLTKLKDKLNNNQNTSRIKNELSSRKKNQLPVVRVLNTSKTDVSDNMFYDLTTEKNHNYLAGNNTMVFIHNTVLHGFIGERMPSIESTKKLVKTIAENYELPYYTITPSFSICPVHGYIPGEHEYCPKCDEELKAKKENE